jgi:RNA polymerase sigma-70 factor (ECF subfamily)
MKKHELDISTVDFEQFLAGSQIIFRKVFDRYHKSLYYYANSILKDEYETEEVVQNAFIQLFKIKHRLDSPQSIYPYLFVITKRMVAATFRKRILRTKQEVINNSKWDEQCDTTEQTIYGNDLNRMLLNFIDQLPPKQKEIYLLNKIEGYNYEEISKFTGTSKNTIKNQLINATKKIRTQLAKYYIFIFLFFFIID